MRRVLGGVVAGWLAALSANAAEPVDWTGFYVGGQVGYNWSHRIGKNFSAVTGNQLGTFSESTSEGVVAGVHGGYDYMFASRIVLGAELEANRSWKRDQQYAIGPGAITSVQSRQEGLGSVRARLGYAFADAPLLPYLTAGVSLSRNIAKRCQLVGTNGGLTPGVCEDAVSTNGAPIVGIGAEFAFLDHWSAKFEWMYVYSHEPFIIGSQSGTFDVGRLRPELIRLESRHITLGVSYHF